MVILAITTQIMDVERRRINSAYDKIGIDVFNTKTSVGMA